MQNYKMYSIYDSKVAVYSTPYFYRNAAEFLRAFSELANDPKSRLGMYPADFVAFELGSWCDENCAFELYAAPKSLGVALEFVQRLPSQEQPDTQSA